MSESHPPAAVIAALHRDAGEFLNWRTGAGAEGLAEGPLSGDERTLTECNATSQFDPQRTSATDVRE
jgi:hypothetical protein